MYMNEKIVRCPKCGYEFSPSYSRAVACYNCSLSVLGDCGYLKCPRCGYEFPYKQNLYSIKKNAEKYGIKRL